MCFISKPEETSLKSLFTDSLQLLGTNYIGERKKKKRSRQGEKKLYLTFLIARQICPKGEEITFPKGA